jgi:hypothetical protein
MGQNVNYLLGNQSQMLGADPETYRQQLIQQEQQRIAAMPQQNQLGATIGGLLGRGGVNLAQGRGFFEVTNPVLQKITQIQDIYSTSMKDSDPNDPMSFYTSLQKNFADAGLGQQAMMASVEAKKFESEGLKTEAAKTALYKANPALLDAQIEKARTAGDDKLANQLAQQRGQIQVQVDLDRAKEIAQVNLLKAQTDTQKASAQNQLAQIEAGKSEWKPLTGLTGETVAFAIKDKSGKIRYERVGGGEYVPPGSGSLIPGFPSAHGANIPATSPATRYNIQTGAFEPIGK